jgi:hypothetical protein
MSELMAVEIATEEAGMNEDVGDLEDERETYEQEGKEEEQEEEKHGDEKEEEAEGPSDSRSLWLRCANS